MYGDVEVVPWQISPAMGLDEAGKIRIHQLECVHVLWWEEAQGEEFDFWQELAENEQWLVIWRVRGIFRLSLTHLPEPHPRDSCWYSGEWIRIPVGNKTKMEMKWWKESQACITKTKLTRVR